MGQAGSRSCRMKAGTSPSSSLPFFAGSEDAFRGVGVTLRAWVSGWPVPVVERAKARPRNAIEDARAALVPSSRLFAPCGSGCCRRGNKAGCPAADLAARSGRPGARGPVAVLWGLVQFRRWRLGGWRGIQQDRAGAYAPPLGTSRWPGQPARRRARQRHRAAPRPTYDRRRSRCR